MSTVDQADLMHTPAPWRVFELPHTAHSPEDSPAHRYKHIGAGDGHTNGFALTGYLKPADARLIAAAPDMVKALQAVLLFYGASSWTPDVRSDWKELTGEDEATTRALCNTIRATLAKAGL